MSLSCGAAAISKPEVALRGGQAFLPVCPPFTTANLQVVYLMTISQTVPRGAVAVRRRRRIRISTVVWFTMPAAAIMLLVLGVPLVYSFYYSLTGWSLVVPGSDQDFIGLLNYTDVLRSSEFWAAIRVTLIYAVVAVSLECALGILFAVLLNLEFFAAASFAR